MPDFEPVTPVRLGDGSKASLKLQFSTHFNIALQVLLAVKDSNAAPSSSNPPVPNAARGKIAVPRAKVSAQANESAKSEAATAAPATAALKAKSSESAMPKVAKSEAEIPKAAIPQSAVAKVPVVKAAVVKVPVAKATNSRPAAPPVAAAGHILPKFRPLYIFGVLAILVLTTAGGVAVGSYNNWSNSQQIAPNVRIAGEPIGGMTRDQAIARLNERFGKLAFTLKTDDKNVVLGLSDIGGRPSIVPTVDKALAIGRAENALHNFTRVFGSEVKSRSFVLPVEWNRGALTSRLQIVNEQYARPAVDARLVTVSGATPRVTAESTGRALDVSATADAIQKSYYLGVSDIPAVTRVVAPQIMATDLDGRDVKLGQYRTDYNGGIAGRTANIHVACRAIDGQVLMPGEVLSFNGLTGERTYKKGYRMAHIFLREKGQDESQVVDGLAGGVCQVSSTLYNAVRKTNAQSAGKPLKIVERNSHSLPVTYVPSGRDATVAWPSKDFKFRNDNNFPVYVRTKAGNGNLTISIWGRVPQNQALPVSLEN